MLATSTLAYLELGAPSLRVVAAAEVTEVETAPAIGKSKRGYLSLTTEVESSLAARPKKSGHLALVAESETAETIGSHKTSHVVGATEIESALATRPLKIGHLGFSTEIDTTSSIQPLKTGHLGLALEVESAGVIWVKTFWLLTVDTAREVEAALTVTPKMFWTIPVGTALEIETAMFIGGLVIPLPNYALDPTTFSGRLYQAMRPVADLDTSGDFALLCNALGAMFQPLESLINDRDDGLPGYSTLLDVDTIRSSWLAYLAQFIGQILMPGLGDTDQRAFIKAAPNFARGRPKTMIEVAKQRLIGTRSVRLAERDGSAWRATFYTIPAETPDPVGTLADLKAAKPAWDIVTLAEAEATPGYTLADAVLGAPST